MNYLRSEYYRVLRLKSFYVVTVLWVLGFGVASKAFVNTPFYGSAMVSVGALSSFFLAVIISSILIGKNLDTLKQSISFGVSRGAIYLVKFFLSLAVFVFILSLSTVVGFFIGRIYLNENISQLDALQVRVVNVLPLLISSLLLCQWMNFSKVNGVVSTIAVFFLYLMSSDVIQLFDRLFFKKDVLTNYFPSALLETALNSPRFEPKAFFAGVVLTFLFLILGVQSFNRRDVS